MKRTILMILVTVAISVGITSALQAQRPRKSAPKSIEAQEFILVDSVGRKLARLGVGEKGYPRLTMMDKQGELKIFLSVHDDECAISVNAPGTDGNGSIGISATPERSKILVFGPHEDDRIRLAAAKGEGANVSLLSGKDENGTIALSVAKDSKAKLLVGYPGRPTVSFPNIADQPE
jgi:hypothetical protein